jgi:predicted RND superfamily exporter protein
MDVDVSDSSVPGAAAFERAAIPILLASVLLTLALGLQLYPVPPFNTDISEFAPETNADIAEQKMSAYFPPESRPMFIHVFNESGEGNVLSMDNLHYQATVMQYLQNRSDHGGHYIASNISAPGVMQLILDETDNSGSSLSDHSDWETFLTAALEQNATCGDFSYERAISAAAFMESALLHKNFERGDICDWLSDRKDAVENGEDPSTISLGEIPSAESTLWVLMIDPNMEDVERQVYQNVIRDELRAFNDDSNLNLTFSVSSIDLMSYDVNKGTLGELAMLVFGAVIVVVCLLALAFRSIRGVAFPLVGLSAALVWTYGGLALANIEFSVLEVAVAPVVLGLGIDYSIHLQRRYDSFRAQGMSSAAAWLRGFETLRVALMLAVVTTIAAFLANVVSPLQPLRTFGFALALGVFSAFICSTVLVGALHVVMERAPDRTSKGVKWARLGRFPDLMVSFERRHQAKVFGVVALVTVGAIIVAATNLETEFNLTHFLDEDMEVMQARDQLYESYEAAAWKPVYILVEPASGYTNIEDTAYFLESLRLMDSSIENMELVVSPSLQGKRHPVYDGPYPILLDAVEGDDSFGNTYNLSIFEGDLVSDSDYQTGQAAQALFALSNNQSVSDPLSGVTWSERVADAIAFNEVMGEEKILYIRMEIFVEADSSAESTLVLSSIRGLAERTEKHPGINAEFHVAGDLVRLEAVLDGLSESQLQSTVISLAVCFTVLLALTRKIGPALLVVLPVALAAAWVVGAMATLSLNWNVLTVMVTALTIGLGIDYSIHIWRGFEEMREKEEDIWECMREMFATTGVALLLSAGTTICGFAVLLISRMPVVQDFGVVTAITVFFSLLLAMVLLPVLLAANAQGVRNGNGN